MKLIKKICFTICFTLLALLTGCASYHSVSLSALDPEYIKTYPEMEGIAVGCKVYTIDDCYDYLDRNVIKKGYQPIQLTFLNTTDKHYIFSTNEISIPCIDPERVAKKVHTSTIGRVTGYSIGGILLWPFFIPAVVDGILSFKANSSLDKDFNNKAKQYFEIEPNSFIKTLIFVLKSNFSPNFDITLFEKETEERKNIKVCVSESNGSTNQ